LDELSPEQAKAVAASAESEEVNRSSISAANPPSDIWAAAATVCKLLFDRSVWDADALGRRTALPASSALLNTLAADSGGVDEEAHVVAAGVRGASPHLQFLANCLARDAQDRPNAIFFSRSMQHCLAESNLWR
jgi:hypothetical protein